MKRDEHVNDTRSSEEDYVSKLRRDGFCVIRNLLPADVLGAAQRRFQDQAAAEAAIDTGKNHANKARGNQWVGMLLNKGEIFFELIDHPQTTALVAEILGADFTISAFDGHIQHAGADAMAPHIDQWWMPTPNAAGALARAGDVRRGQGGARSPAPVAAPDARLVNPPVVASVMFMLTDFTVDNGATRVVPTSHLSGEQPDPAVPFAMPMTPITAPAGSALVFDGRLWHAAGENRSNDTRMGVLAYYAAPFCRPLENYLSGMHRQARERCPPAVLARLGYRSWQMYGHTGDLTGDHVGDASSVIGELVPE